MGKVFREITGSASRKRRESDLQASLRELQAATGASAKGLMDTYNTMLADAASRFGTSKVARKAAQSQFSNLIAQLKGESESQRQGLLGQLGGDVESAYGRYGGQAAGLEDKLRQAISGSLGQTRTGLEDILGRKERTIESELGRYLSGEFTQNLPEIEAQLASRGLGLQGGTAAEALGQELSRLGGVRYQTYADLARERESQSLENLLREGGIQQALEGQLYGTGRQDIQGLLKSRLGLAEAGAGLTREDQLMGQQRQYEDYLRQLGFARESEVGEEQALRGMRGQRLDLEQMIQQMILQNKGLQTQQAQQALAGAQQREGAVLGGLGSLAGSFLGSYALPSFANKFFPTSQNKYFDALSKSLGQ